MNAPIRRVACVATLILAAACGRPGGEVAEAAGASVAAAPAAVEAMTPLDHAVATARAIRAMPAATDSILSAHGLTRAGFNDLMYDIAADAALAEAYTNAMNRDVATP